MSKFIVETRNYLKKRFPKATVIDIKLSMDRDDYVSAIHVVMPGRIVHAEKKAASVWKALDLAATAAIRQLDRSLECGVW